ncbi:uncharacterized protein N7503_009541 [Penicillium pulvis]|uniref:uncharacterized protein n=1 Tax=Penicillium pulvis TaxID=1562058 RepID=UPI0025489C15|nr:uncharacterized protein N7503_009541 [Penicillium pulvis]KAJ5784329.1 hypothetical protein N7503_009541 [Penicillium pulvis]
MDSPTLPADEAVRDKYNVGDIIDELFNLDLNPTECAEDLACDVEESWATPSESTQDFITIVEEHQCHVQEAIIDKRNIIIESLGYIDGLADAMLSLYEWFHPESTQGDVPANWEYVLYQLVGIFKLYVRLETSTAMMLRIKDELEAVMSPFRDAPEEIKAMLHIVSLVMEQNDGLRNDLTAVVSNVRAVCA